MEPSEELFQYDFTQEKREISNYDNFFNLSPKNSFEYKEEISQSELYQSIKFEEKIIKQSDIKNIIKIDKNQNNFQKRTSKSHNQKQHRNLRDN